MNSMAYEINVDPKTIRTGCSQGFGMKSYGRTPRHLLTDRLKQKRLERARRCSTSEDFLR
ncbi:Uncharacterized protein FKW44_013883 [Caligus rogercresseyi]|uniref:Uncharacterized protein n=1 Tax=Caligus rogercresseyi TaxID=217165 RepID=A0A7T8GYF2_CALRO|nr:Uncharacterized protein FKW44_013883 [Caligus rogercresseyi]